MNNERAETKEEEAEEFKIMCSIFGLSPKDLKSKIDIYGQDSSGKR